MQTETPAFIRWLDRFFDAYYAHRPVNATFIGIHDHDHRLPDFSENGAGDTLAEMQRLLQESRQLPQEPLSAIQAIDRRLAQGFLEIQTWEYTSNHFHRGNPSLYTGEAVFGLLSLFLTTDPAATDQVGAAIARMEAVPTLLAQGRTNVRQAPPAWTERAVRESEGALAFLTEGLDLLAATHRITDPCFKAAAARAATAFADFQTYLTTELHRHPSDCYACGDEALALYLREGHALNLDADAIVAYAEAQMAEVARDLEAHAARTASAKLQAIHPTAEHYYARYQELWDGVRATAEGRQLLTWPDFPLRYVPRPAWARKAAPALYFLFYRSPAAFNRPPVHDYLVTPIEPAMPQDEQRRLLQANNDSVIKLNHVIHHGSIGHHVQNWHAFRSASRIGQVAAVDCAARIALFCGGTMAEGWACYATDLMGEVGFLTPLEQLAEQQSTLRMCARAVVDVRLHQGRFTLAEAANYYTQHAEMTPDAAQGEAVKNSMFPGAAVMYLTGRDEIHRLRKKMAARRRNRFALRTFHDELLSYGSIPVTLAAADMLKKEDDAQ